MEIRTCYSKVRKAFDWKEFFVTSGTGSGWKDNIKMDLDVVCLQVPKDKVQAVISVDA